MQFNGLTHPTCKILIKIKMQYKCLYTEFAMKIFLSFSLILIAMIGGLQHYVSVEQQSSEPHVVYADIADSAQVFDSFELKFLTSSFGLVTLTHEQSPFADVFLYLSLILPLAFYAIRASPVTVK